MSQPSLSLSRTAPAVLDVVIVGAGFGGLCMAIKLREAGNENFVIVEKASEVGGAWRDNHYPGCACDVQSHMYSFSFEGNPDWSKRYAPWNEIQGYILRTTEKYGIRPFIRFNEELNEARFDERTATWIVRTKAGTELKARHVVVASGPLHVPNIPNLKGLDRFKGKVFHSAQWDHAYPLEGKRVASIGTGGSAIQYVPEIAPKVQKLDVYQRHAAWVVPRDERTYSDLDKWAFKQFPLLRKLHRAQLYWTNESRVWPIFRAELGKYVSGFLAGNIRRQVRDPAVAKKLTPDYALGCKRILISNVYYPTFNRPNVELVTDGIREVTENGIVTADGVERPTDAIILGTGFIVDPRIYMRDVPVVGLDGRDLREAWKNGAEAYYGVTVAGFPNLYQLVGPNAGLGHNSIVFMIEAQVHYILACLTAMKARGADYVVVSEGAQRTFNEELQAAIKNTVWASGCTSWYQQDDGKNFALWPYSTWKFWLRTRKLDLGAYVFGRATGTQALRAAAE
jgi:cation diffusion facilitator CzcD-associated flavoprotein CzcO